MLILLVLSAVSVNAQVRIGGDTDPDGSALLDVNKTDDPNPAGNLGLGLPRVELTSATQPLATGNTPKPGTMVYNTGSALDGAGVYYWATNAWAKLSSGNADTATMLATARAITLTGNVTGTADFDGSADASIATTLADNAVTSANIANLTIVNDDIANSTIEGGKLVSNIALAGSPTTTTQATATNNTTIATTAFVKAAAAAAAATTSAVKRVFYANNTSVTNLTGVVVSKTACMPAGILMSAGNVFTPTPTATGVTVAFQSSAKLVCIEFN
ncbi:hypothetical protein FACS189421_04830 [Bacteroidia bacterium]|nr:hypothetical protein FACS189421_04830 [Bacteroidia bacterium]GHT02915.1 hypothetical protein FACS189423_02600 [Bacteroidia bacterium]